MYYLYKINVIMKFYVDIGYTNIKIMSSEHDLQIYSVSKDNLQQIIKLAQNNNFIYIMNNNVVLQEILEQLAEQYKQIHLITTTEILSKLNLSDEFNKAEIGLDLLILMLYLKINNFENALLISCGSANVCLIWKQHNLYSVSINLGMELSQQSIAEKLYLPNVCEVNLQRGVNTLSALSLGNYLMLDGLIKSNRQIFNLEQDYCVLTGNTFNHETVQLLSEKNENVQYQTNLVLQTLKQVYGNLD
ncbi:hypothetical protein UREOM_4280 [Ureaplasma sp. OM1]|uniref:Pantothenate kinase n=2 Tax=Ureaplasma ceti TaxID=3119530 RepID=A0ABP9U968_9BACT